jgi:hypothetical protein
MKKSNIKLGESSALAVTTAAVTRALTVQDLVAGRIERPYIATNQGSLLVDMPRPNPTTLAAIKAGKSGKVADVSLGDL